MLDRSLVVIVNTFLNLAAALLPCRVSNFIHGKVYINTLITGTPLLIEVRLVVILFGSLNSYFKKCLNLYIKLEGTEGKQLYELQDHPGSY